MQRVLFVAAAMLAATGCNKKTISDAAAASATTKATTAPTPTPAPAATPTAAAGITPSEKAPFDALEFKPEAEKDANGWPIFDVYNAGMKVVTFANLTGYAYDKDGKLVARTKPLSWNPGKLASGAKSDWTLKIGDREAGKVSDKATEFEICYDSIWFDGEAKADTGKACDDKRKMAAAGAAPAEAKTEAKTTEAKTTATKATPSKPAPAAKTAAKTVAKGK